MAANLQNITETSDAFIVDGITIQKIKRGQMNMYDPSLIKTVGKDLFFQLISPKEPIAIPDLGFSENDWDEMQKQLHEER